MSSIEGDKVNGGISPMPVFLMVTGTVLLQVGFINWMYLTIKVELYTYKIFFWEFYSNYHGHRQILNFIQE